MEPAFRGIDQNRRDHAAGSFTSRELSKAAGVPEPFQLIAYIASKEPFALEKEIHRQFDHVRKYGKKKEFFVISKEVVVEYFRSARS